MNINMIWWLMSWTLRKHLIVTNYQNLGIFWCKQWKNIHNQFNLLGYFVAWSHKSALHNGMIRIETCYRHELIHKARAGNIYYENISYLFACQNLGMGGIQVDMRYWGCAAYIHIFFQNLKKWTQMLPVIHRFNFRSKFGKQTGTFLFFLQHIPTQKVWSFPSPSQNIVLFKSLW